MNHAAMEPAIAIPASCPTCGGDSVPAYPETTWYIRPGGRAFGYAHCSRCGLLRASPLPTQAEVADYYADSFNYSLYSQRAWLKRWQGMRRWRRLRPRRDDTTRATRKLLDIGCGHGWFMLAAKRDGWDTTGIDLPSEATAYAREKLGLKVLETDFLAAPIACSSFDVVSLWHVLEHMLDPFAVLTRARDLLKPNGTLIVGVPNVESRGIAQMGASWIWLQQPFVHPWHYSASTLNKLLQQAGFTSVHCTTRDAWDANYTYDAVWFPTFAQKSAQRAANLGRRTARKLGISPEVTGRNAYFYVDETARLAGYAVQRLRAFFRTPPPEGGSELLAVARPVRRDD